MDYRFLQQHIKPYKEAGYTTIRLNAQKSVLEKEYHRLLGLNLSYQQLEQAIFNREKDRIKAIDPFEVYVFPERYKLNEIRTKVFELAHVSSLQELRGEFPALKDKDFDFRYKLPWVECLLMIAKITQQARLNQEFYDAVERAIEIELKSLEDDFYRHETSDLDLYTLLSDNKLAGPVFQKNQSNSSSLMRAYITRKCEKVGLNPSEYFLV
ncbi:hypothetical protein XM38_026100 [Halomicronema hongdechloris C2206]|uniref:Uncharacterized protein n=1 Tax=Halomicronema hongdechloris C2206 TaxID=1641165 RepID=A0A1Z3HN16_9CYAN|nr:hypothetical protein [Halomicronema hongdechloris]ASC71656.1 hypothetical protein XM38_026100 [Halomicronema hongdechloris C2206]